MDDERIIDGLDPDDRACVVRTRDRESLAERLHLARRLDRNPLPRQVGELPLDALVHDGIEGTEHDHAQGTDICVLCMRVARGREPDAEQRSETRRGDTHSSGHGDAHQSLTNPRCYQARPRESRQA